MNCKWLCSSLCIVLTAFFMGCATPSKEEVFGDVQEDVEMRTGKSLEWNDTLYREEELRLLRSVEEMLADELSLNEAVQIALLNNQHLQSTYEQLAIARASLVQAGLLKNPVFDGSYKWVRHGGHVIEMGVVQDFMDVMMTPLKRRIASTELEEVKAAVTAQVLDVAYDTRRAYIELQMDRQTMEMFEDVLLAAEASYEMAGRLRNAGNITKLNLFGKQAIYEEAKLQCSSLEIAVLEDRERLNTLMGLWGKHTDWTVTAELPEIPEKPMDLTQLEKRAIENSLDLSMSYNRVKALAQDLGMTNITSVFPEFGIGADSEREPDGTWVVGPMLDIPLPLFDQGQAVRSMARAQLRRAWREYSGLAVEIHSSVRRARHRLLNARRQAVFYRKVFVPLSERIMAQTQLRYNGMLLGVFELLQAKQSEINAKRRYIQSLRNYWIARSELQQILDGRLTKGASLGNVTGLGDAGIQMGGGGGH